MNKYLSSILLTSLLFISTQLSAGPITWDFSGSVITPTPDNEYLDNYFDENTSVQVGDRVSGSISWDPYADVGVDVFDNGSGEDGVFTYAKEAQWVDLSFTFQTASGPESFYVSQMVSPYVIHNWLLVTEMVGTPFGTYDVLSLSGYNAFDDAQFSFYFRLVAPALSNLFSLEKFDPTPPDLEQLQIGRLNVLYENPETGEFDSLFVKFDSLVSVPEPSTIAVISLGLVLLGGMRRQSL